MPSGLAGAKAGILGGIFFAAAAGLFNVLLLEVFKGSVIAALQQQSVCTTSPTTPQDCFSTLLNTDIPSLVAFPIGVLGILFGALYGMYFEFLPGYGYLVRAFAIGLMMFLVMLFFRVAGLTADPTQTALMYAFDLLAMVGYVAILARFYRRYTRMVKFESPNPSRLKITVDHKNYTGKTRTFSVHSSHTVRAPSESGTFHEWLVSGGVSVLDSKSFETTMRVDGDGLLKIT